MSSNQQFTQAQGGASARAESASPMCTLNVAVLTLLASNVLLAGLVAVWANSWAQALRWIYEIAFFMNPAALISLAVLCAALRRRAKLQVSPQAAPELEEAKLQHLGAAIRPHFFFNALNAVMGLIRVDPRQAENVLQDTAELFRSVMAQHENRLVTLAVELETCEQYIRIEQARLAQRLMVLWQVDTALNQVSVPPFCLQPLIENAIRHGIEPLAKGGTVTVDVHRLEQNIVLRVSNPMVTELEKYQAIRERQHNGIALDNIAARLKLMYDQAALFEHGAIEGRYEAQITLPLEFVV